MRINDAAIERCRVAPGTKVRLEKRPTRVDLGGDWDALAKGEWKDEAAEFVEGRVARIGEMQDVLAADNRYSVLLIFQGIDASGKDGTIKHVTSGINPAGMNVVSFKEPSKEELDRHYLWRHVLALPRQGQIGVHNRSHYEEVGVVRVHPELLKLRAMPHTKPTAAFWQERFESINAFEHHMQLNGMLILKFFLHVSKEEQKQRLLARLTDPTKHWKFNARDLPERARWDEYQGVYSEAITATSTEWAPWWIIPADSKPVMRALVAEIVCREIGKLKLRYPPASGATRLGIAEALETLRAEG